MYAEEHDVVVAPEEVADAIAELEADAGGADALDQALAAEGLTRSGLGVLVERLLLSTAVQRAVVRESLTESALSDLYEQSKNELTTVEVSHIVVETRAEAQDVVAEATPRNFAELAARRSIDTQTASAGGGTGST
jgi:parvulin-like peptidyl-prolyl isomerase